MLRKITEILGSITQMRHPNLSVKWVVPAFYALLLAELDTHSCGKRLQF